MLIHYRDDLPDCVVEIALRGRGSFAMVNFRCVVRPHSFNDQRFSSFAHASELKIRDTSTREHFISGWVSIHCSTESNARVVKVSGRALPLCKLPVQRDGHHAVRSAHYGASAGKGGDPIVCSECRR